jgi:Doubled CXXCH motif (Paired_CXXCH_1)
VAIPGGWEEFKRHPASTVNIGALGGGHSNLPRFVSKANQVQVMSPTGQFPGSYTEGTLSPSCFSCHKGHGNQNAFGLIYMVGTGAVSEEGDATGTQSRNTCRQCHTQGGAATIP